MATRLELKNQALADLGDPDGIRWGAEVNGYLNDAQVEFAKLTGILRDTDTLATVAGTQEYDLTTSATDFLELVALDHSTGATIPFTNESLLSLFKGDDWRAHTGAVRYALYGRYGNGVVNLYPKPAETESISVRYARLPVAMAADASEADGPEQYHRAYVEFAKWRCYARNTDEMSVAEGERAKAEFFRYAAEAKAYAIANFGPTTTQGMEAQNGQA